MLENKNSEKTLVLIDGNAVMHRAFHGLNKNFVPTFDGKPVGMVYGFASTLINVIDFFHPNLLVITFDTKEKTFRHKMDAEYKAQRSAAPDDFYAQIPPLNELVESFALPTLRFPGFESDDLIGTLAKKGATEDFSVKIVSGDLDFTQLVSDKIQLVKLNGKISDSTFFDPEAVRERYELDPKQMIDFKAISGDSSDNYAGVPGVGPKTTTKILQQFGSIQNMWEQLDKLNPPKLRNKILEFRDQIAHCQKLAEICTDVPLQFSWDQEFAFASQTTLGFFEKMRFHALSGRFEKLIKNYDQKKNLEHILDSEKSAPDPQLQLF